MSITFNINQKALQSPGKKTFITCPIDLAFNTRAKTIVEASGAGHANVIGVDPTVDYYTGKKDPTAKVSKSRVFSHALMEAIHESYSEHYPLILSPDVIWLTVAQGFANHINMNAEKLRKQFVDHEGKKQIKVQRNGFLKGSPSNDWPGCFDEFSAKIREYIGKKHDLVVSNFSTTTPINKAVSELVLMHAMKSYFRYSCHTICGIPTLTLLGSTDDWKNVRTRIENLAEFDLDWWIKAMVPVMDHFVSASEGNPDLSFWNEIYKVDGGSGGPYCSGWINTLFPYLEDYKGNLYQSQYVSSWKGHGMMSGSTLKEYPNSLSKVPFKWEYYETVYDMEFLGGLVGVNQDPLSLAIEPVIGWAVNDTGISVAGPLDETKDW
jgi:hypothetical protein